MKNLVMIVVPVYKAQLNVEEKISLQQLRRMLGHYPICFAAPESLATDFDGMGNGIKCERWSSECFVSVKAYSQLLMSREFYERFSDFEYIFIHQLDGFVFSDRLREYCEMGYDYIGAPIPRSLWLGMPCYVGNGGISLRRVQSMIKLLSRHKVMRMPKLFDERDYCMAEDAIICYWLTVDGEYRVPSVNVAADFALDQDVQHCFSRLSEKNLPFACHGWQHASFPVWRRFIESQGYDLTGVTWNRGRLTIRMRAVLEYLIKRLFTRAGSNTHRLIFLQGLLNQWIPRRKIAIWGYGRIGQKFLKMLEKLDVSVDVIYDEKNSERMVSDIKIVNPCRNLIARKRHLILISSSAYEKEIAETVESWGLLHGWDYLTFEEFLLQLGMGYLSYMAVRSRN